MGAYGAFRKRAVAVGRRGREARGSACGLRGWAAFVVLLLAGTLWADYIAEVKEGGSRGYLYIGKGAIKRQGLPGWSAGDLIVRDDRQVMYFVSRRLGRRPGSPGAPSTSAAKQRALERLREVEQELESSDGEFSVGQWGSEVQETDLPTYETRVVPYAEVFARRQKIKQRLTGWLRDAQAHIEDPGMVAYVAMLKRYFSGEVQWTNTGETEVIAGRDCVKYRLWLAPIFKLDVWTADLGPGYTAGHMFDKVFNLTRGGIPPMEALAEVPGFPLKMEGEYRNPVGFGTIRIRYEVLSLLETDLDEREFEPRLGSFVYQGKLPGWGH